MKLEIALAIPASNDDKYNSNNSAGKGLTRLSHVFDGEKIQRISKDVPLGNIVGECSNEIRIKVTTDDFIRRANTVMSQFKLAPNSFKYRPTLFKSFCSSLYGFLLWDMSAKSIDQ